MKKFGIDVSKWQGNFDFKNAQRQGVKFAILKAGGSDGGYYKDSKFESYYKNAKSLGLDVGAYYFSTATTRSKGIKEAEQFISYLKVKQFELPVYIDVENCKVNKHSTKNKQGLTDAIIGFCETMEKAGYWVGIYANKNFFQNYMYDKQLQQYGHWLAEWSTQITYKCKAGVLGMWQFGGETNKIRTNKVAGQVCDQDYLLVDYPSKIKAKGKNGFSKSSSSSVSYYHRYRGKTKSLVDALNSLGINSSFDYRQKIAKANGISNYEGTAQENTTLLDLLKEGKLIKA